MSERGVIYYNTGTSCAVRLLVSLHSLRKHYSGPVTILSEGEESHPLCERIAAALSAKLLKWESGITAGKNRAFLAKTCLNAGSPFETSIALDSDTLIVGQIDELFEMAESGSFCVAQFSKWKTTGGIISRRIRQWREIAPDGIEAALGFGPAINTGVMAFKRCSSIFDDWKALAEKGREFFIPDEVSCQLLLPRHQHRILDPKWNRSCKYDDPDAPGTRIIHYHGRKHCRHGLPYHAGRWIAELESLVCANAADVRSWMPAGDRLLARHLCFQDGMMKEPARLVLGAGNTRFAGWISTDKHTLNVTRREDWMRWLGGRKAVRLLAEHVWEHLSMEEMEIANRLAFEFLAPGGCLRIAVPDGMHPDPEYLEHVRPHGSGPSACDHKQLLHHQSLYVALRAAGFEPEFVEHWDEAGVFHFKPWASEDGHVKRSALHDRRNRKGALRYTSLIVDAWKR